jgi:hypothetical protein
MGQRSAMQGFNRLRIKGCLRILSFKEKMHGLEKVGSSSDPVVAVFPLG